MIPPYGRGGRGIGLDSQTGVRLGAVLITARLRCFRCMRLGKSAVSIPLNNRWLGGGWDRNTAGI